MGMGASPSNTFRNKKGQLSDPNVSSSSYGTSYATYTYLQKKLMRVESQLEGTLNALKVYVMSKKGVVPEEFAGLFALQPQGPPGTGKTTSILALAHELLGPNYKEVVLELNASDDRNIERLIQSICALVQFARLSDQEILGRLMVVVAAEKVNHGVKSPVDISMDITRLIQTLNMSTTAFRDGVKLTLEAELASTS
uniref:Replication factor C subunit 2-like n=1 Tax=Nicotiana sylvestris TaxID=4096 RepID=A0A1U7XU06_NICSY|nr:PREDICTED: replication factor C subunit 2-like [Nicotiana sylvestris]